MSALSVGSGTALSEFSAGNSFYFGGRDNYVHHPRRKEPDGEAVAVRKLDLLSNYQAPEQPMFMTTEKPITPNKKFMLHRDKFKNPLSTSSLTLSPRVGVSLMSDNPRHLTSLGSLDSLETLDHSDVEFDSLYGGNSQTLNGGSSTEFNREKQAVKMSVMPLTTKSDDVNEVKATVYPKLDPLEQALVQQEVQAVRGVQQQQQHAMGATSPSSLSPGKRTSVFQERAERLSRVLDSDGARSVVPSA